MSKLPDLSTRQLRAFLALAEQRSFTRAAEALHLSQPAFSALIRALEEALDARLFDRSTRSVELTPEGRLFEVSARRLLGRRRKTLRVRLVVRPTGAPVQRRTITLRLATKKR